MLLMPVIFALERYYVLRNIYNIISYRFCYIHSCKQIKLFINKCIKRSLVLGSNLRNIHGRAKKALSSSG